MARYFPTPDGETIVHVDGAFAFTYSPAEAEALLEGFQLIPRGRSAVMDAISAEHVADLTQAITTASGLRARLQRDAA